jgi:hypothetical protein
MGTQKWNSAWPISHSAAAVHDATRILEHWSAI